MLPVVRLFIARRFSTSVGPARILRSPENLIRNKRIPKHQIEGSQAEHLGLGVRWWPSCSTSSKQA